MTDLDSISGDPIGWHYTTPAGAIGMLRDGFVYASWATLLNDSLEVRIGAERICAAWVAAPRDDWPSEVTDLLHDVDQLVEVAQRQCFVFCVAESSDSLSHWQLYGNGGIALGFGMVQNHQAGSMPMMAVQKPSLVGREKDARECLVHSGGSLIANWYKVAYLEEDHGAIALHALDEVGLILQTPRADWQSFKRIDAAIARLTSSVLQIKHPGFRDEKEWRYIAHRPLDDPMAVHYRAGRNRVIPYLQLTGNPKTGAQMSRGTIDEVGLLGDLPLAKVLVGPGALDANVAAIEDMLTTYGYGVAVYHVVDKSETPFRA